jgi:hypothetical protein
MNLKEDFYRRVRAGDGPWWRWNRAGDLLQPGRCPDSLDDAATLAAWRFRLGLAGAPVPTGAPAPNATDALLPAAHAIFAENGPLRWEIEARLIVGTAPAQVAERLGIDPALIDAYTTVFFDVIGRTDSIGWLASYLPIGFFTPPNPTEAEMWMHVAATGVGAKGTLDVLVADFLGRPDPVLPDRHQAAEDIRALVRFGITTPTPTPAYRQLLKQMWRVLATRVTIRDPREWEAAVAHMDNLELAAGVKQSCPSGGRATRSRAKPAGMGSAANNRPDSAGWRGSTPTSQPARR